MAIVGTSNSGLVFWRVTVLEQIRREIDDHDRVQLVVHHVHRRALQQEAVAGRDRRAAEINDPRFVLIGVDVTCVVPRDERPQPVVLFDV